MRPDQQRWRRIEQIYHAALEHPPSKRGAFVAGECRDDEELRREVESLLGRDRAPGEELIDRPAWQGAGDLLTTKTETQLTEGTQLGPYRIEQLIGSGGMGRVYRARDIRLGRAVAIKVSAEEFTGRFEREARAIAALTHPHICTLFDVGPNYLVMELVEGESLADRLRKGPLRFEDAIRYGSEIADALAAAHARGVVHRDLKPGNVMITASGAKVLDFGLAKIAGAGETLTRSNAVMGTPAYMAPEQREGRESDARTDLFALGLLLYEAATGKRLAPGQIPLRKDCRHNSCTWWSAAWRRSRRSGGSRRPTYAGNCCGRASHARAFRTRRAVRRRRAGGPGSLPRWLRSASYWVLH
jgi:eukaryotic-like serine/threonine-protein kinase